ncbi:MAG: ribbon-helix-helix protein, CopG family [Deltaproteobacteria bacterium]|nr:MAG: ribbon-helix-helix protein, CopG family [Deltaproteobacteria bacterium]
MATTAITVRVDADIARRLDKLAKATRRSRSFLAAEAIEEYLSIQEWQVQAIRKGLEEAEKGRVMDLSEVKARWEKRLEDSTD